MLLKLQLCQDNRAEIVGWSEAQRNHNVFANLIKLWLTQFDRRKCMLKRRRRVDVEAADFLGIEILLLIHTAPDL